jgi:hypothetical protein
VAHEWPSEGGLHRGKITSDVSTLELETASRDDSWAVALLEVQSEQAKRLFGEILMRPHRCSTVGRVDKPALPRTVCRRRDLSCCRKKRNGTRRPGSVRPAAAQGGGEGGQVRRETGHKAGMMGIENIQLTSSPRGGAEEGRLNNR